MDRCGRSASRRIAGLTLARSDSTRPKTAGRQQPKPGCGTRSAHARFSLSRQFAGTLRAWVARWSRNAATPPLQRREDVPTRTHGRARDAMSRPPSDCGAPAVAMTRDDDQRDGRSRSGLRKSLGVRESCDSRFSIRKEDHEQANRTIPHCDNCRPGLQRRRCQQGDWASTRLGRQRAQEASAGSSMGFRAIQAFRRKRQLQRGKNTRRRTGHLGDPGGPQRRSGGAGQHTEHRSSCPAIRRQAHDPDGAPTRRMES